MTNHTIRSFRVLKTYIRLQGIIEEKFGKIRKELDIIEWDEENRETRMRLYQELGKLSSKYRENRIMIYYYNKRLLEEANLTG